MTIYELKTLRAMVNDSIENFKKNYPNYDDEDIDTACYVFDNLYWRLFGRHGLNKEGFCRLIENSVRKALCQR